MRFSGSPALGEAFVIRGEKNEASSEWNLRLESAENDGVNKEYNSVQGLIIGDEMTPNESHLEVPFDHDTTTLRLHSNEYKIFKDEFDHGNHLSLTTILDYFERPRSQSLGGATGLSKLQEDGILAVVTRNDNLLLYKTSDKIVPGDSVKIQSYATLRRKSLIRYTQMVYVNGMLLALGALDVMSIDQLTKRPKPLPTWAL